MIKRVRKRPRHNHALQVRKGLVYVPKAMIGQMVKIMPLSQYRAQRIKISQLYRKLGKIKDLVYYEYSRLRPRN